MSVSGVSANPTPSVPTQSVLTQQASAGRASDGDTAAQEAAEGTATKMAEARNGGYAPNSAGLVNKLA